ncbi:UDP-4-amino-4-deoxy-L-arabinose--oxoglutarate aminotransferase [wastewater metagenome]|uniref:UDP-4-amino-4-deoxy-L-arabinose--oxoglutarate aminotransferase n=2 Tax=unclassified sequences TaxID=12908 RepID=A0A5B8RDM8_9ZZZZ|nr:DegT/DnrJ/EryC1/StrS aminotransferase family protein [Arhodomonas sp. KWT]QEA06213.1 UDP-4-amino-4-deoxy-L-arabinose--oxoglutarate aminotransferase [uncultured organism]
MRPWPSHDADEIEAVQRVLASGRVNYWNGEEGRAFEREFAAFHGIPYAVAVANGSVALELALRSLGIGEGDEVIVTPRTFLASASSIVMCGARPVFADVDPVSQNITPETARAVLTERTRAVMTVHVAGWPCDMPGFIELAREKDLRLIEDCAQAHGATINGHPVGSFGDAAAFSFCTDKIMTTGGEGGMVLFRDEGAWRRGWSYKDHGKDWDAVYNREHPPGFRWLHESFGTNWRLTEMQSAVGRVQLRKLPEWSAQRRANAQVLTEAFSGQPALRLTVPPVYIGHAYYKYYAFIRPERLKAGWDRDRVTAAIRERGVPCMQGSCSEVYLEKAFDGIGLRPDERLPAAQELGETSLMFVVHPTLTEADMAHIADVARDVLGEATQ